MDMVNVTIDGRKLQVPKSATVLTAAKTAGINVPSLCYHPELRPEGACRVCVVEVEGAKTLVASCVYPVNEGMVVHTNTAAVREARKTVVELLLANHPQDCLSCQRNTNCELQTIAADMGIRKVRFDGVKKNLPLDANNPSLVRDPNKCILCGRCIKACSDRQGVNVYSFAKRGFDTVVAPAFEVGLELAPCTYCGQCASVCPTAAIVEKDDTQAVWAAISDPTKHVIVQTAPATRVALGEALGMNSGSIVTGKMVASLRRLGFDKVFDTDFTADLTIMEEGHELLHRLQNKGVLPMVTSCSPGWVNFIELMYPDLLPHLSTAKSPQQMFGALAKTYYAEKTGIDVKNIVSVSIMPCTAKKAEAVRPEFAANGVQDVDYVLTTRELGRMIKESGIDFAALPAEEYDAPFGISTGAGVIFGSSGGVMEAALRFAYEVLTGKTLENVEFEAVRGLEGVKEASLELGGLKLNIAVAHGTANAQKVLDSVRSGEKHYDFIEVMCCPGGCVTGGGQPIVKASVRDVVNVSAVRAQALYTEDAGKARRKSQDNEEVKALYKDYLGEIGGERAHHILHTTYVARDKYAECK